MSNQTLPDKRGTHFAGQRKDVFYAAPFLASSIFSGKTSSKKTIVKRLETGYTGSLLNMEVT